MTHRENTGIYVADEGKMLVRKADGFVMGDQLDLGVNDSIENYEERTFTEDERAAFWASLGRPDPKKRRHWPKAAEEVQNEV